MTGPRGFLTFLVEDSVFALPMEAVGEVVRRGDLVPVPLSPPSLEGLLNLRGRVLPVVGARRLLGGAPAEADDHARLVVLAGAAPVAFAVDAMRGMRQGGAMAPVPEDVQLKPGIPREILMGLLPLGEGLAAPVLDTARLVDLAFAGMERRAGATLGHSAASRIGAAPQASRAQVFISFDVAGQEFALAIAGVREIIRLPDRVVRVPHAVEHMLGVVALREELLPLVSLSGILGLGAAVPEGARIVVARLDGVAVGLVVDRPRAVLRIEPEVLAPVPALMSRAEDGDEITAIARLDGDRRLISILATERLFRHRSVRAALERRQEAENMRERDGGGAEAMEQLVVFRLAGADYAVPAPAVEEVMRMPESLTRVPKAAAFVEGVANRRGGVLPVIDLRRRFDMPVAQAGERRRILVLRLDGVTAGFAVDAAHRVVNVPHERIGRSPDLSPEQAKLFPRVADIDGRMVLVMDPAAMMSKGETGSLLQLASGKR